jgi:hypothetical protein
MIIDTVSVRSQQETERKWRIMRLYRRQSLGSA